MSIPAPPHDEVQEVIDEGPGRYVPYLARLRTALVAGSRFTAYTSELGEALRPVVSPSIVRAAYGISWLYIGADVSYAGWRAHQQHAALAEPGSATADPTAIANLTPAEKVELRRREHEAGERLSKEAKDMHMSGPFANPYNLGEATHVGLIMTRRAVFQSIASMALPAFTVHSVVRYSSPLFKNAKPRVRRLGPTLMGLLTIPALPFMFDEPVEHAIDYLFDMGERFVFSGGPSDAPPPDPVEKVSSAASAAADSIGKAALLGVGVDMLFFPRLRALATRQAARIASARARAASRPAPQIRKALLAPSVLATQQLAQRVLCANERREWGALVRGQTKAWSAVEEDRLLKWLAVRWTAKEAAYKAAYPHVVLGWKDLCVHKAARRAVHSGGSLPRPSSPHTTPTLDPKPHIALSDEFHARPTPPHARALHPIDTPSGATPSGGGATPAHFHLSVSHDGEYVVAFVVAHRVA